MKEQEKQAMHNLHSALRDLSWNETEVLTTMRKAWLKFTGPSCQETFGVSMVLREQFPGAVCHTYQSSFEPATLAEMLSLTPPILQSSVDIKGTKEEIKKIVESNASLPPLSSQWKKDARVDGSGVPFLDYWQDHERIVEINGWKVKVTFSYTYTLPGLPGPTCKVIVAGTYYTVVCENKVD